MQQLVRSAGEGISKERIADVFRALESAIAHPSSQFVSRFAFVQLVNFIEDLEMRFNVARDQKLIKAQTGRGMATEVIELYVQAHLHKWRSRGTIERRLKRHKRIGKRWKVLAGPSIFLLSIFSDVAETTV